MAQDTAINATLQARDWEFLFGIPFDVENPSVQDALTKLRTYYGGLQTKPQGNENIVISTTEGVLVSLYRSLLSVSTQVSQTNNVQPYTRIRQQVLSLNNVADNYILNAVNLMEQLGQDYYGERRKSGRKLFMMTTYDNN